MNALQSKAATVQSMTANANREIGSVEQELQNLHSACDVAGSLTVTLRTSLESIIVNNEPLDPAVPSGVGAVLPKLAEVIRDARIKIERSNAVLINILDSHQL